MHDHIHRADQMQKFTFVLEEDHQWLQLLWSIPVRYVNGRLLQGSFR